MTVHYGTKGGYVFQIWMVFEKESWQKLTLLDILCTQSRQKSYSDVRRGDLEFKEGDWVFLKVTPHEGDNAVSKEREIESEVVGDPSAIVPVETIEVSEELSYEEIPIAILDRQVQKLRNKEIASVNVLWRNQQVEESTWEAETEMRKKYPHLFE
ncbi:PREDICTED: uncharacterized protein LOC109208013 [Nicotiana attenuata]|uniref:uncharacterized protein LOC109208013 n=1 Tax=Nicotiana attenuata TaxID=49451 RepID=UPI00090551A4|nr:PREDICTED: uncharacterized protein LOC109208013 [Nicotiana attenuata]